jgi:hypothetical protein
MRILFDQGVPRGLAASLCVHEVVEARKLNQERISNGALLKLAEEADFDLLVTTDKNVRYQQNLTDRKISIVVPGQSPWWLVRQHLVAIVAAVNAATTGSFAEVEIPFPK